MLRVESGVAEAANAVAVHQSSLYVFDRSNRTISRILKGNRTPLKWNSKEFSKQRWTCLCLFVTKIGEESRLGSLWFDSVKRGFAVAVFRFGSDDSLRQIGRKVRLDIDADAEALSYAAEQCNQIVQIIFFEKSGNSQRFWLFEFDGFEMILKRDQKGTLPSGNRWEMPFVSDGCLYFVRFRPKRTLLATFCLEAEQWVISDILGDPTSGRFPSPKLIWCHCWDNDRCVFLGVPTNPDAQLELWVLFVRTAIWRRVNSDLHLYTELRNGALRFGEDSDLMVYGDLGTEGILFRLPSVPDSDGESDAVFGDVICPVCLEEYSDPKTLGCGHSLCGRCLDSLLCSANGLRCPVCRRLSLVPSNGIPTNYGLRDAIEVLERVRRPQQCSIRCSKCRSPCSDRELWICMQCDLLGSSPFCANCILRDHDGHSVRGNIRFREINNRIQMVTVETEKQMGNLFSTFRDHLDIRLRSGLLAKALSDHSECLGNFIGTDSETSLETLKMRSAVCVRNVSALLESALAHLERFLEVWLFFAESGINEAECRKLFRVPIHTDLSEQMEPISL